jgi:3-polyprenyl-4-hydroxybenzoate decarboxylase
MECEAAARRQPAIARPPRDSALAWRDLRDWIAQIERELARVTAMVDPHEELGAVTLLASRQDKSPALIFEKMQGDTTGSRMRNS